MKWIALVAAALGLRLAALAAKAVIINDGIDYVGMAELIAAGRWSEAMAVGYHPGYPVLISVAGLLTPFEAAGYAITIACGVAALPILYTLFREASDERTALWGAVFYAIHPMFVRMQSELLSSSLFLLLFLASVLLTLRVLQLRSIWNAAGLAGTLAALYAVRPEGLLAAGLALGAIALRGWHLRADRPALKALAIRATVVAAPLAVGAGGFAAAGMAKSSLLAVAGKLTGGTADTARPDAREAVVEALHSLHPIFWLLAIPGAVALRRTTASTLVVGTGVGFFAAMALGLWLVGYSGRHYYMPAAALLLLPAAAAAASIRVRTRALIAATAVLVLFCVASGTQAVREKRVPYRRAGEWIRAEFGPGQVVFSDEPQAGYYARGTPRKLPRDPETFLSRADQFVVTRPDKAWGERFEPIREAKGLVELRRFELGVTVYRITK